VPQERLRRAARDVLLPLFDALDRNAVGNRRKEFRRRDPKFKDADDRFQREVEKHQKEMMEDERRKAARDLKAKRLREHGGSAGWVRG
jgi:hypothetical protein